MIDLPLKCNGLYWTPDEQDECRMNMGLGTNFFLPMGFDVKYS